MKSFIILIIILSIFLAGCAEIQEGPKIIPEDTAANGPAVTEPIPQPVNEPVTSPITTEPTPATEPAITEPPVPLPVPSDLYVIEADEFGFYPNKISVNQSDDVKILLVVRNTSVYSGGLDFRSSAINGTLAIKIGDTSNLEFVATKYTEIQSFQPGTNRLKAGMAINVN